MGNEHVDNEQSHPNGELHGKDRELSEKDRESREKKAAELKAAELTGEAEEASPSRLNWLRASVLGANDGVVSTAGLVLGVAGASADNRAILVAGAAGLVSGSLSMAAGEYVSVSTQRDAQRSGLDKQRQALADDPQGELDRLTAAYEAKGISHRLAREVATELSAHDALGAHAEVELGIDPDELLSPWHAAFASMVSFALGSLVPLLLITLMAPSVRVGTTVVAAALALALTGVVSARLGGSPGVRATLRNIGGGMAAIVLTFVIGALIGAEI